jgi:hypothetical protein
MFSNFFAKKSRDAPSSINTGRVSFGGNARTILSPYRSRNAKLLEELRRIRDEANAIEFITKKTPDASMGLWNFIRYANQGHQMKFFGINTRNKNIELIDLEEEWREFAARINSISNAGLDGMIDIFHKNGILYGLQMCEVEVSEDRADIVEVHPIDPRSVTWELEERNVRKVWIPYQQSFGFGKVDLSKANIFAVPFDPDGNDPRGNLIMAPALEAIDSQLQVFNDVHAVLHHQGYVRDFYQINGEKTMSYCPPEIKNNKVKLRDWLKEQLDSIVNTLSHIHPDADIVTYDDVTRNQGQGGGNTARSVDFRAINELTDIQTNNGLKQLSTFTNRHTGKTETYTSVEMKIFVQGILSLQRGSKRLMEEIARLWLRVKGVQATPVFTHNVVDWQSELDKESVALLKQKRYAIAVMMKWIDNDTAAREVMGSKKSCGEPSESVRVSLSNGMFNQSFKDNDNISAIDVKNAEKAYQQQYKRNNQDFGDDE